MKRVTPIFIFIFLLFCSCSKDDIKTETENELIGIWVYSGYRDGASIYTRARDFDDINCYKFNHDNSLIERKNSGWCGTPPIAYANFDGTWRLINDTLITVKVGYWGGTTTYKLDIESVNNTTLEVKTILPDN